MRHSWAVPYVSFPSAGGQAGSNHTDPSRSSLRLPIGLGPAQALEPYGLGLQISPTLYQMNVKQDSTHHPNSLPERLSTVLVHSEC